jgi:mannose-6-phosphate isomerase-like protein (cupin superfamily)
MVHHSTLYFPLENGTVKTFGPISQQPPIGVRHLNIEQASLNNNNYRHIVYTDRNLQVVLMSLDPNQEIGMEVHEDSTQFIRIEKGEGYAVVNDITYQLKDGVEITIPYGNRHNIVNNGSQPMKLYTIYSPPTHAAQGVQKKKTDPEP